MTWEAEGRVMGCAGEGGWFIVCEVDMANLCRCEIAVLCVEIGSPACGLDDGELSGYTAEKTAFVVMR